jgi:tight adherence protein C
MLILQAVIFGLLIGGFVVFLGFFLQQRSSFVSRRLQMNSRPKSDLLRPQLEKAPSFLSADLAAKIEKQLDLGRDSARIKELRKRLIQAGIYNERATSIFFGVKLGLLLVLPVLVLIFWWSHTGQRGLLIVGVSVLLLLGYFLPDLILDNLVKNRQKKIRAALPDALDLLVVCVEAGQGLNAAIKRVSDDLMESSPILARELLLVNLEIMAGLEREQALRNLGERTGVDDVVSLCNILIQSDRFGTSIGQALRTQSEFMRTTRRKRLEELAAKTPVKLVFPLLLFIFPAIMVVVLGPAIIQISEFFSHTVR